MAGSQPTQPYDPTPETRGRVVGITDGLFAIALTLIVIEIRIPARESIHSERDLVEAIIDLGPRFLAYAISFLTLTIFWFGQQAQHELLVRSDRRLATLHLSFLAFIALLPFSTGLLADFLEYRTAVLFYWLNLLMLGITLYASWRYATRHDMIPNAVSEATMTKVQRRIVGAQVLWAIGAALGLIIPSAGIGFILVIQLIYVIGPRIPGIERMTG